jgi:propanol-preferring alcohol dehydrogenase
LVKVPTFELRSKTCLSPNQVRKTLAMKANFYMADRFSGPDQVLLRLNATGICYSDLHYMLNDLGFGPMSQFGVRSPGHEGAGVVVKVGSNVTTWKVGDRGGVKPCWDVCMNCALCWNGQHETHCAKGIQTGFQVAGTYQQYIVSPARYTTRIPDGVDDFCAGPIMCSGSTIYRSVSLARYLEVLMAYHSCSS